MSSEYIYTMYRVDKFYGPDRQVLANISLSFFPGREDRRARPERGRQVDAPADHGRARRSRRPAPPSSRRTRRSGFSSRSRGSTPRRTCAATSRTASASCATCSTASTRSPRRSPSPTPTSTRCSPSRRRCRTRSTAPMRGSSTSTSTTRWTRCACPKATATSTTLSGGERRRVALCRLLLSAPDLLLLDEPTNHLDAESVAWLERFLADYKGTVVAVTHDRYFLDNVAGWILELDRGRGIPFQGNYSSWLEQKQDAARDRGEDGVGAPAHARARARVGAHEPARASREVEGAPRRLREAARRGAEREARQGRDPHSAGPAARRRRDRGRGRAEGLRRPAARRGPDVLAAAGRHRRRRRPERRRQDDALPHDRGRGEPGRRRRSASATRCSSPTSTSRAPTSIRRTPSGRRSAAATTSIELGKREVNSRQYVSWFNFKGGDQQKRVGDLSGGERNRVHLAKLLRERRQRAAARRADERPRRRHAARARGCAARLRRLRRRHHPRSLVPRPRRDAHPRVRGRLADDVVRGHLGRVRGLGEGDPRRRGARAAPDQVQAAVRA